VIGLYAIARGAPDGLPGAAGEPLRVLSHLGLELVYGEPSPPLSEEALRAHEAAVRRIADGSQACLPARFGSCARGEADLRERIGRRAPELLDALELVRGREQMTLRVLGPQEPEPSAGGPGTRYLEGRRRAQALPELEPLRSALSGLIRAERVEPHGQPGLLASVYHLIDRGAAEGYRQRLEPALPGGLRVSVSGPWPAWSFVPELS